MASLVERLLVEVPRRSDERGVARVDPRVLHVLRHGHADDLAAVGHRVHVDLLGLHDELAEDDRVLEITILDHLITDL